MPGREGSVGVIAADNRLFVEAVLYRYRTGTPWRDLPERFGDGVQVHRRFSRWAESGVWERVFQHLAADAYNEVAMIDSTIVRAHQHSAGVQKSRRGPSDPAVIASGFSVASISATTSSASPIPATASPFGEETPRFAGCVAYHGLVPRERSRGATHEHCRTRDRASPTVPRKQERGQ
jgi:transposase